MGVLGGCCEGAVRVLWGCWGRVAVGVLWGAVGVLCEVLCGVLWGCWGLLGECCGGCCGGCFAFNILV